MTEVAAPSSAAGKPVYGRAYTGLVLSLLVLAYTLNFIDRTIISTIGQAIKADLKITDAQLGLLGGPAFALLYTFLGIPLARVAERANRVSIIGLALLVWSAFTALCGFAGGFVQLLAFRVGVGVGEAGLAPSAHSLISDYYEPRKRASALSIYSFGIPLGTMFGAALGGWLAKTYGWRVAFMVVGAPGVIVAVLIKLLIKEPPRGHSDPAERPVLVEDLTAPDLPHFSLASEFAEMGAVAKSLFLKWPIFNMIMGVTLVSFAGYGAGAFSPPYFIRTFGLDLAVVGLIVGLLAGFSNGIGTLVGGFLTDWAGKRSKAWYALAPAIGVTIATGLYVAAYSVNDWHTAVLILLFPGIFAYTYLGPTFGVIQNVVETRRRATATALMLFVLNLIGLGMGPPFAGWLIDHFAQFNFTHPGQHQIWPALTQIFGGHEVTASGGARFAAACPGGAAPKGSPAAALAACKAALNTATREGIIVTWLFGLWGAFHYFLASFGVGKELDRVAAERKLREA